MQAKDVVNIAIVANCQARPLAETLRLSCSRVRIGAVVITHLAKEADQAPVMEELRRADLVLAQAVQDAYPIRFVRTSNLRAELGGRLITWPNIFFKGQCPDLCYLTKPNGKRVLGPLGEYQSHPIYAAWRAGESVAATKSRLLDGEPWARGLAQIAEDSLADLRSRERGLDVAISPHIEEQWRERRLFFTFNHPSQHLLSETAAALMQKAGLATDGRVGPNLREPLDRIIPALLPAVVESLRLRLPVNLETKGCKVELSPDVRLTRDVVRLSLDGLIEESFKCLDAQNKPDEKLRIT